MNYSIIFTEINFSPETSSFLLFIILLIKIFHEDKKMFLLQLLYRSIQVKVFKAKIEAEKGKDYPAGQLKLIYAGKIQGSF